MLVSGNKMEKQTIAHSILIIIKAYRCIGNSWNLMAWHIRIKNVCKQPASIFVDWQILIIAISVSWWDGGHIVTWIVNNQIRIIGKQSCHHPSSHRPPRNNPHPNTAKATSANNKKPRSFIASGKHSTILTSFARTTSHFPNSPKSLGLITHTCHRSSTKKRDRPSACSSGNTASKKHADDSTTHKTMDMSHWKPSRKASDSSHALPSWPPSRSKSDSPPPNTSRLPQANSIRNRRQKQKY